MALRRGTTTAPHWISVLEAAETWGRAPWEIASHPGPLVWWLRYCAYRDIRIDVEKEKLDEMKRKGGS